MFTKCTCLCQEPRTKEMQICWSLQFEAYPAFFILWYFLKWPYYQSNIGWLWWLLQRKQIHTIDAMRYLPSDSAKNDTLRQKQEVHPAQVEVFVRWRVTRHLSPRNSNSHCLKLCEQFGCNPQACIRQKTSSCLLWSANREIQNKWMWRLLVISQLLKTLYRTTAYRTGYS